MCLPVDSNPPSDRGEISPWRELLLLGAALLLMLGVGLWWMSAQHDPAPGAGSAGSTLANRHASSYVGARTCAECHPGEAAYFSGSGHARTLRPAASIALARWLEGRSADDPDHPEARWTYDRRDGRLVVERSEEKSGRRDRLDLEFAFGSGEHATTFLSVAAPDPNSRSQGLRAREHRLSFFAGDSRIDVTPGQLGNPNAPGRTPLGRDLNELETRKCFACHSTRLSSRDPTQIDLESLIPNVSCERCHGPGRAHVEAARRGESALSLPFGPGRWTAEAQMRLCGQCHRLPEFIPKRSLDPENPILVRFQPVGLMQSRCYKESAGTLSCVNCHNPHARTSHDQGRYEAACLSCHRRPAQVSCAIAEEEGCIGCHMPRRDSGQGMQFTDHWIRRTGPGRGPARGETGSAVRSASAGR